MFTRIKGLFGSLEDSGRSFEKQFSKNIEESVIFWNARENLKAFTVFNQSFSIELTKSSQVSSQSQKAY